LWVRKGGKMSEGAGAHPPDLWRQWYDANSRMWSSMLGSDSEALMDPFGLYRQWFGGLEETQKPATRAESSQEVWRQWAEATAGAWQRAFGIGTVLAGLAPHWAEMAEGTRKEMVEGGLPTDPLDLYLRWYNATNAPLSKMIREVLEDETFLEDSRRFLENYATLEQVFQRASEEYFGYLQLSTRSDNTRVAELVVGLDAKVDRMEEAFEEFEHGHATPATAEAVETLEGRVKQLERKLDDNRSELRRMEGKLDQLLAALGTSTNGGSPAAGPREDVGATDAARRKARELGVDLREVRGSGSGGRITVDDVRRRGEAG
jgi:pyruvate/2-oxoglutarate dehydrogenase complex dihydrolipoamide acyltransferase (E2) component